MHRVTVLGSGSRGNAILIDGTDGAVLVDAGFGRRSLVRRLKAVQRQPEEIGALGLADVLIGRNRRRTGIRWWNGRLIA